MLSLDVTLDDTTLTNALWRGIEFLSNAQGPTGQFSICRYDNPELTGGSPESSIFPTLVIACALADVPELRETPPVKRAVQFVQSTAEDGCIWRYWPNSQVDADLDDTSLASFLLAAYGVGTDQLVSNVSTILANRDISGLCKTWIRASWAKNDVDLVVNCNIALYLGTRHETAIIGERIVQNVLRRPFESHSWYYPDNAALYYAMSRLFSHGNQAVLPVLHVLGRVIADRQQPCGSFGNPLITSLFLTTLANFAVFGERLNAAAVNLLHSQQPSGAWQKDVLYAGPEPPRPRSYWWGSESITTALCLEGLAKARVMVRGPAR